MACLLLYAFIMIRAISIFGCNAPFKQVISSTQHCRNNVQLVSLGLIRIKNVKFVNPTMMREGSEIFTYSLLYFLVFNLPCNPLTWCLPLIIFYVVKLYNDLSWQGDILFQYFFWQFLYTNKGYNISVIKLYRVCGIGLCLRVERRLHGQWDCWNANLQLFWGVIWIN
jgi:hypothetical protein